MSESGSSNGSYDWDSYYSPSDFTEDIDKLFQESYELIVEELNKISDSEPAEGEEGAVGYTSRGLDEFHSIDFSQDSFSTDQNNSRVKELKTRFEKGETSMPLTSPVKTVKTRRQHKLTGTDPRKLRSNSTVSTQTEKKAKATRKNHKYKIIMHTSNSHCQPVN